MNKSKINFNCFSIIKKNRKTQEITVQYDEFQQVMEINEKLEKENKEFKEEITKLLEKSIEIIERNKFNRMVERDILLKVVENVSTKLCKNIEDGFCNNCGFNHKEWLKLQLQEIKNAIERLNNGTQY